MKIMEAGIRKLIGVDVNMPSRKWLGLFTYQKGELRELEIEGYERQPVDGVNPVRFEFKGDSEISVQAIGLFSSKTGRIEKPFVAYLQPERNIVKDTTLVFPPLLFDISGF